MNMKTMMIGAMGGLLLMCSGCGEGLQQSDGEKMDAEYRARMNQSIDEGNVTRNILGTDINITFNMEDEMYWQCYTKTFSDSTDYIRDVGGQSGYAFAKRKAALEMSREVFCYSFKNYFFLDGVSGFIYNVSYIMQVPHKLLRGIRAMDGLWRYIKAVFKLILGAIFALVGLVLAPIVNTVCHPFETLSNLLVGIYSGNLFGVLDGGYDHGTSWFGYVFRTNIIASLWDLIWGGMIYPLWQALIFWL